MTATYSRDAGETVPGYHITATLSASSLLNNYIITNIGASLRLIRRACMGIPTRRSPRSTPGS